MRILTSNEQASVLISRATQADPGVVACLSASLSPELSAER
jgi:hypothetical protein